MSKYLRDAGTSILGDRRKRVLDSLQTVRPREEYEYMDEVQADKQAGRQRVLAWEAARVKLLERIAVEMDMRLSSDQVRLLDEIRNALLVKMYGNIERVVADLNWIRSTLGVDTVYDAVAIVFPRRSGKTLTQTIASAITAVSQPSGNVLDYNPNWDQAKTWLNQTVRWLYMLKNDERFGWKLEAHSVSRFITITTFFYGKKSSVYVYGSGTNGHNAQNLRGTGENAMLVNFDEGFFFDDETYRVTLPVVANGAAFVITSSAPMTETASFNLTRAVTETGHQVMKVHNWSNSCSDCQAKERRLGIEIICSHTPKRPSNFRSRIDEKRLAALMKPFGAAAYAREVQNRTAASTARALFEPELIEKRLGLNVATLDKFDEVTHFFIGIDPGSVQRRSDTALVSMAAIANAPGLPLLTNLPTPLSGYNVVRYHSSNSIEFASSSSSS